MATGPQNANPRPTLRVSEIGEFVRFNSCVRRAKLAFQNRRLARQLPFYGRLENTLDVVLQEKGAAMERAWERDLVAIGLTSVGQGTREAPFTVDSFAAALGSIAAGVPCFAREVTITGRIGAFAIEGRIDFLVLRWNGDQPILRVVEGKASRKDRTYQRLQIAAYVLMLREFVGTGALQVDGRILGADKVEGIVARIDEDSRRPQDILGLEALDLATPIEDVQRLLAVDGPFDRTHQAEIDALPYVLEPKCDACVFSVHCFPESARQRKIELVGTSPSTVAALHAAGLDNLDSLADLDLESRLAQTLRESESIEEDIERLSARARVRRKKLPGADDDETFEIEQLPLAGLSQLPAHEIDGVRLIRIYMVVDYDYVEDRVVSISAHVTSSSGELRTPFAPDADGRIRPDPRIIERGPNGVDREVEGRTIVRLKSSAWRGELGIDAGAEIELLEGFFQELTEAISATATTANAPIHFYFWSPGELTRLMEACARGGPTLIRHLRELLGCRLGREQLIATALQSEVDRRFALGWTGRGLSVATSLRWFGQRFHWQRRIGQEVVELDRKLEQDIFDFLSTLSVRPDGAWAEEGSTGLPRQRFEIRSRFNDSLSMPYFRVLWGQIRSSTARWRDDPLARRAIERYETILQPAGILRSYFEARTLALRWIEERNRFKNDRLEKPPFEIAQLGRYLLGVNTPRSAAIDVLRIDWQVRFGQWRAAQTLTSMSRISSGRCLPLADIRVSGRNTILARIAPETGRLPLEVMARRYSEDAGSFVRLMPWSGDGAEPARLSDGVTCNISSIDWDTGDVQLQSIGSSAGEYSLASFQPTPQRFALLEASVTDFIAPRVERRLNGGDGPHVDAWFDLTDPQVDAALPLSSEAIERVRTGVASWRVPGTDNALLQEQVAAAVSGSAVRIQALQGPPGTGKTATTAMAIIARISLSVAPGQMVLISGPTHRAVNTIASRLADWAPTAMARLAETGASAPPVRIVKLDPRPDDELTPTVVRQTVASTVRDNVQFLSQEPNAVTVLCGTPSALLKLEEKLGQRNTLDASLLVVDEASMMVFPHLLALATLTNENANILVAGDNRQLSPILAHNWEHEERPPTIRYQPFLSAYEAVARIAEVTLDMMGAERRVLISRLRHSFRLPPSHRAVVGTLYRQRDAIELTGTNTAPGAMTTLDGHPFSAAWTDPQGLVLITHNERASRKENQLEREIVHQLLEARPDAPPESIVVLTPHRSQRARLREQLEDIASVLAVDTVERLQGGEAETVIITATASDPAAVLNAEQFLMSINRANVAFSRAKARLIVIASETLLDHISADLEVYESAMLWKELRRVCGQLLSTIDSGGTRVRIFGMPPR